MWLYMIAAAMVFVGVILGFLGGGIFTIVLVPLGLIALATGAVSSAAGRKAQRRGGGGAHDTHTADSPLPHEQPQPSGRAPTSPESLADARRAQQ